MGNWSYLGGHFYIVRTQAGFKHALRHYARGREKMDVDGYPGAYPSLISISFEYAGGPDYMAVRSITLKDLQKAIEDSDAGKAGNYALAITGASW